jgi:transposase-like protein
MSKKRKVHSGAFKAKVALEAYKGLKPVSELAGEYGVHPVQISQWKKQLLTEVKDLFSDKRSRREEQKEESESRLYEEIGRLKVELDWLKKKNSNIVLKRSEL